MTLHAAMAQVLAEHGALSAAEIARKINRLGLYTRGDGKPIPASQISARANKYRSLFTRESEMIRLSNTSKGIQKPSSLQESDGGESPTNIAYPFSADEFSFQDIGTVDVLIKQGLPSAGWLDSCGIYRISLPSDYEPEYIGPEEASAAGNVISPWSVERLKAKWLPGTTTAYIGLAGCHRPRSLHARLRDLLRHASGRTSDRGPHKGGEIIWQLCGHLSFSVSAAPTGDPPMPRNLEKQLLAQFMKTYGSLPFANRQR